MSTLVVVVGTYIEPDGCLTELGHVTVAEPVVDIVRMLVWPGLILVGLIYVFDPLINCNVK